MSLTGLLNVLIGIFKPINAALFLLGCIREIVAGDISIVIFLMT